MRDYDCGNAVGTCNLNEPRQPDPNLYNLKAALARLGGDVELLREMISFYLEDYEMLLERIDEAAEAGDPVGVSRNAHSLKGLAANFDAVKVVEAANATSKSARTGSGEMPVKEITVLTKAADKLAACLQAEMESDELR